jgi:hypothetical protein
MAKHQALARANAFCETFNTRAPILMALMAGACPVSSDTLCDAGNNGPCRGSADYGKTLICCWDSRHRHNAGLNVALAKDQ